MMTEILKYTHFLMITLAVLLFIVSFVRLKMNLQSGLAPLLTKLLTVSHIAILLLGTALAFKMQTNPLNSENYWLLEKIIAFGIYIAMVKTALKPMTDSKIQWLTFLGAFGWLVYIGKLSINQQAILLVG